MPHRTPTSSGLQLLKLGFYLGTGWPRSEAAGDETPLLLAPAPPDSSARRSSCPKVWVSHPGASRAESFSKKTQLGPMAMDVNKNHNFLKTERALA